MVAPRHEYTPWSASPTTHRFRCLAASMLTRWYWARFVSWYSSIRMYRNRS